MSPSLGPHADWGHMIEDQKNAPPRWTAHGVRLRVVPALDAPATDPTDGRLVTLVLRGHFRTY